MHLDYYMPLPYSKFNWGKLQRVLDPSQKLCQWYSTGKVLSGHWWITEAQSVLPS